RKLMDFLTGDVKSKDEDINGGLVIWGMFGTGEVVVVVVGQ
ncbi:hypothetical protein Tco_1232851, partial [Tanacetum coccineum]